MSKIIGIDLGSANSRVAVLEGGEPILIPSADGTQVTPSVVSFSPEGYLVGWPAKQREIIHPDTTVSAFLPRLGTDFRATAYGKSYTATELAAMLLRKLQRDAEAYLGEPAREAVIAVPPSCTTPQREAICEAGRLAGLEVRRIMSVSTAAAMAYAASAGGRDVLLLCDLGAETCSAAMIEVGDGVVEVIAEAGSDRLGGSRFDDRVAAWLVQEFRRSAGVDLSADKVAMLRLREAAEKARQELSVMTATQISLPYIAAGPAGPMHLDFTLTRDRFHELTGQLAGELTELLRQVIEDSGLSVREITPKQISAVILTGGASMTPFLRESVRRITDIHPRVVSAECSALGAALSGGVLNGDVPDLLALEVLPYAISIETAGGARQKMIERNTVFPTRASEVFSTAADNQRVVEVNLIEGEGDSAHSIGRCRLDGITPAPKGKPRIRVTVDVDSGRHIRAVVEEIKEEAPAEEAKTAPPQAKDIPPRAAAGKTEPHVETLLRLLPVYDNLLRAVAHEPNEHARQGMEAILKQFRSILNDMGVTEIEALHRQFDPRLHEAVVHIEDGSYGKNEIVLEFEKGFRLGDRVIRVSKVQVAN